MARNKIEFRITAKDEASRKLQNVSKSVDTINSAITRLATTVGAALSVRKITEYADTWRMMQNRIKLVTESTQELAVVTRELVRVSVETRSSYEATANLYARVARSSRELGLSQQELLDFTTTVQQSIRISGSTAAEASAGVIQFGQALASSRLSGDELRSVLEQMPRLAQAIADGMGIGIGRLREFGEQGLLSTTVVLEALRKAAPEIADEFSQLTPLVSEAFVVLESSLMGAIGQIDAAAGASDGFAAAILEAATQARLLGAALSGQLTDRELDQVSEKTQIAAASILAMAFALGTLKDGLDLSFGTIIDLASNVTSRMAESAAAGGRLNPEAVGKGLRLAWEDTLTDIMDNVEEQNDDILGSFETLMSRLQNIIKGGFKPVEVDLNQTEGGGEIIPRAEREAMESAGKQLQKMFDTLKQQQAALILAKDAGIEYGLALQFIKANALGVASGSLDMARDVAFLAEQVAIMTEEAKPVKEKLTAQMKFMEKVSIQAAANIQDAFANFLFDPFEDGVKGMLEGFLKAVRRMLAEMLAFQALSSIPGLGSFFSATRRAAGGPVSAGQPVLVGERGPEMFVPRGNGSIVNNSAMGSGRGGAAGAQFVTNIDARGADPGLIARLPQILDARDKQLLIAVARFAETGTMPI